MASKFTHLTFDCYGTLIDWRSGVDLYLGKLLRRRGLQPEVSVHPVYVKLEARQETEYKSYRKILRDTAISVARHFNLSITEKEAQEFAESIKNWKPFDDTVNSLKTLGRRGYKRVILSNVDRDLLRETITQNNLEVDGYITAEDVASYKPLPAHWIRFFDQYRVTMERTLHVAQSLYHDIKPSADIGLSNAWINRYGDEKAAGINPTWVFSDLAGLLERLD